MVRAFGYSSTWVTPNTSEWEYAESAALFFVRVYRVLFKVQRSNPKSR